MGYITWSEKYSVHVAEIDGQHKKLFDLVNALYDAMEQGKGKNVLASIINAFVAYTEYHFSSEERLLAANFYPGFSGHKEMHENLTRKARQLKEALDQKNKPTAIEVMLMLANWLNLHILEEDRKYKSHIKVVPL
jgi:hemerythrin-like metal-binding protein